MKALRIAALLLLVSTHTGFCQQDPLYAQYINNPFVLNPAYAGFTNDLNVNAGIGINGQGLRAVR